MTSIPPRARPLPLFDVNRLTSLVLLRYLEYLSCIYILNYSEKYLMQIASSNAQMYKVDTDIKIRGSKYNNTEKGANL